MENVKPILVVYCTGKARCSFSGKVSEGATVTFADKSIVREHLSWTMLKKLLVHKERASANTSGDSSQTERQS